MISKKVIEEIGFLDEIFNPGYGEDIDYCFKVRNAGYRVVQVPDDASYTRVRDASDHTINFPLYHPGSKTVHSVPKWNEIVERNERILRERYNEAIFFQNMVNATVERAAKYPDSLPNGWFSYLDVFTYATHLSKLPSNATFVEIGVWEGRSLCSVADIIRTKNLNVIAIDTFEGTLNEDLHREIMSSGYDFKSKFLKNISDFGIDKNITLHSSQVECCSFDDTR
jgi:hypothetical protein